MNEQPHVILVAYKTKVRDPETLWNLVAEPTPNGTLKDPVKIEADIAAKKKKFEDAAAGLKATGDLAEVMAVDLNSQAMFRATANAPAAVSFGEWVLCRAGYRDLPHGDGRPAPILFYGFDLKPLLRLTGLGMIRAGKEAPLGLWYANDACYDPYDMLVEDKFRDQISLQKLCAEAPGGAIECPLDYVPGQTLTVDLALVTSLCLQYRLIPGYARTALSGTLDATTPKPDDLPPEAAADLEEEADEVDTIGDVDSATYDDEEPEPTAPRGSKKAKSKAR